MIAKLKNTILTHAAVQISAAITAGARIHMYPYISRSDCYYTDTDSVVLSQQLPNEVVGSSLGQFKLEHKVKEGFFRAPKSYCFMLHDDKPDIMTRVLQNNMLLENGI